MQETIQVTLEKSLNPDGINGLYTLHIFTTVDDFLCVLTNVEDVVVKEWRCSTNREDILEEAKHRARMDYLTILGNYVWAGVVVP